MGRKIGDSGSRGLGLSAKLPVGVRSAMHWCKLLFNKVEQPFHEKKNKLPHSDVVFACLKSADSALIPPLLLQTPNQTAIGAFHIHRGLLDRATGRVPHASGSTLKISQYQSLSRSSQDFASLCLSGNSFSSRKPSNFCFHRLQVHSHQPHFCQHLQEQPTLQL